MPPLALLPNQPVGMPDWYSPSGPPSSSSGAGNRVRVVTGQSGPIVLPSDYTDEDAASYVQAYDTYIARLDQMWRESSGIQRKQIEAQIADAKRARENQMEIAQLQDRASRYGIDKTSEDRLKGLKEQARQFDASHALDMQKLGIDRARTATDYLSTSDRFVQAGDFLNLSSRVLAGQLGAGTGSGEAPQMKTMSDYSALEGGGSPGRQVDPVRAASAGGAGADARVKAIRGIIEASPPSNEPGLDNNAYHVLNAARAIYSMNLTPQQQAAIGSDQEYQQMLGSAGKRLGRDPAAWWQRQQRTLPGQGSVRQA